MNIPIPEVMIKKMDDAAPHALKALLQLEQFLAPFNLSLYQRYRKHEYLQDLALMLAADDLDAVGSQLIDCKGEPLVEHRIHFQSRPAPKLGVVLAFFKRACQRQSQLDCVIPRELVAGHQSPLVYRRGKTGYENWFVLPWDGESLPSPAAITEADLRHNSAWIAAISRRSHTRQRRLGVSQKRLPDSRPPRITHSR